jgi:chromosome segregation protein
MRVKRLEIHGFKSFKDKTVVHFDHSITGIVGPNGCGKSNIVDAFFWVMGETSYKHIRGSGSDDLIFNGSAQYSPLGVAEATLVLESEVPDLTSAPAGASAADLPPPMKKKEIAVTRRVSRGGEGEYLSKSFLWTPGSVPRATPSSSKDRSVRLLTLSPKTAAS